MKEKIEKLESERPMMDKHVAFQVSRLEKALEEKQELQRQLICLKEEKVSTEKELQEAARKIEKLEMEKDNQEDSNAIQELVDRLREQELSQEIQQKQLVSATDLVRNMYRLSCLEKMFRISLKVGFYLKSYKTSEVRLCEHFLVVHHLSRKSVDIFYVT